MALRLVAPLLTVALLTSWTSALQLSGQKGRRTAVLLTGSTRNWDTLEHDFVHNFLDGMVIPNSADVFVQSGFPSENYMELLEKLGPYLKSHNEDEHEPVPHSWADYQFEDLKRAFKLMKSYESEHGFKYDVVVKARTEVVPTGSAILDLAGWEAKGRIHMMTDMVFWGQRDDMEKVSGFYASVKPFYMEQHADAFARPILVGEMLESLQRDARLNHEDNFTYSIESWQLYNKLETLPYPDMGKVGAIANLEEALARGIRVCNGDASCPQRCGDRYYSEVNPRACSNAGDYQRGEIRCEKDIMHWVMFNGLVVCDVGKSMHTILFKGYTMERYQARDCDA